MRESPLVILSLRVNPSQTLQIQLTQETHPWTCHLSAWKFRASPSGAKGRPVQMCSGPASLTHGVFVLHDGCSSNHVSIRSEGTSSPLAGSDAWRPMWMADSAGKRQLRACLDAHQVSPYPSVVSMIHGSRSALHTSSEALIV